MTIYDPAQIRNLALVGHQGAGKTTLAEAMLYCAGALKRMGSIADGSTVSDYHTAERERGMSVYTSLLHAEWKGHKLNILDTPGYLDFAGEVIAALKVADTALFVLDAVEGVQVGTELAWKYTQQTETPAMFVINRLDSPDSDFETALERLRTRFGHAVTPVQLPGGSGSRTIIDVLLMKQFKFNPDGTSTESDIDAVYRDRAEELHKELIENIAENDEALMELYFEKGELSEDEMRKGLREALIKRQLYPVFLTVASENVGVSRLMSFINNVLPAPTMMPAPHADGGDVHAEVNADPVAFVFKTMSEAHVGEYSFFRVYQGVLEQGVDLDNAHSGSSERLGALYLMQGHERVQVTKLNAGDLGATVKLKHTATNDTLRKKGSSVEMEAIAFPDPRMYLAVKAQKEGEEDKLGAGLHQMVREDPSLQVVHDANLSQIVLGGQGELHLTLTKERITRRMGVEIEFLKPKVGYRETVQGRARASYRHKKQTGGAGQFADISMLIENADGPFQPPEDIKVRNEQILTTDWGAKIQFIDAIVGGVIDMQRFFGAIQKGVADALREGPAAGYPVGDVRIVIYDGGMHPVDSNENAFKTAAKQCFRQGFREARPVILEPYHELEVTVPESYMGDVISDLNTRRARIQGMDTDGVFQVIKALVPEAELYRYSTALRSLTQGRGLHRSHFTQYEMMPRHLQEALAAERAELEEA